MIIGSYESGCKQPEIQSVYRKTFPFQWDHYSDVIMGAMASRIGGLAIIYSIVYSGADQIKHPSSASLALVREFTDEFPAQRASNPENGSIW